MNGSWIANAFGCGVLLSKGGLLVFLQIWVRWTLPRLRIDQVMTMCLKYCLPIACFTLVGATLWRPMIWTIFPRGLGVQPYAERMLEAEKVAESYDKALPSVTAAKGKPGKDSHEKDSHGAPHGDKHKIEARVDPPAVPLAGR